MKINKLTLYLSLLLVFVSCSDDLTNVGDTDGDAWMTRAYSDQQIQMQRLGYAYNAAGNIMDDSSFSVKPILSITQLEKAEKEYGPIVSAERRHYTSVDIFSGSTLQEMGSEETKYTIDESEAIGCGKYYRKNNTFAKITWKHHYKAHMFVKHIMATKTIDAGLLRCLKLDDLNDAESVLEGDFRKAVADLVSKGADAITEADATTFSEKYGTHLVVSSNLGAMIELQLEINRDSCVNKEYATQQVSEVVLGKQVTNTTSSKVIKEVSTDSLMYEGQIKVKGGRTEDCNKLHLTFDHKGAKAAKIGDGDYTTWANNVSIEPDSYNATFVSGRFLPLYSLFETYATRQVLRQVYKLYMKKEAPTPEEEEPAYGVLPVSGNYGADVRVASLGNDKAAILCQEYVPSIRSDKPCVVAYPLLKDKYGDMRPFLFAGLFVGDESHRPGRVIWKGSASIYTPSDSIFIESDSARIHNLFDEKTHQLKNVYFYWNSVHPYPCPTKTDAPAAYSATVFQAQPATLAEPSTFAKVASTFWSVRPVALKKDNLLKYWSEDSLFMTFAQERHKDNDGIFYKHQLGDKTYNFCLLDGGDNIKRVKDQTDDNNADKKWTIAVSRAMNALGLEGYLPSVYQSKSITKMLGNRMNIFYSHEYDGRNMLGLDWPTGYWVLAHPYQTQFATTFTQNDGQGMPIVTDDAKEAQIMRLSGSGTDLLLEYPMYVRAFNYSAQDFFKFFPIYITIDKF